MLVNGKIIADKLKQDFLQKFQKGESKSVCFVIFGNDAGSRQFISMKCRFAESLGIRVEVAEHPEELSVEEAFKIINDVVNRDFSGIVIQLPLPRDFPVQSMLNMVPVNLDIDVLSDQAKNKYENKKSGKIPPVSRAVIEILNFYDIDLVGKEILVIGTGMLVGKPVGIMLKSKNISFMSIDKNTEPSEQKRLISSADVIISGAGSPHLIKPYMIKEGVILIDAGTSEQKGKIVGDIDPLCEQKASLLTPVPGGVGPVTLASLFLNL